MTVKELINKLQELDEDVKDMPVGIMVDDYGGGIDNIFVDKNAGVILDSQGG